MDGKTVASGASVEIPLVGKGQPLAPGVKNCRDCGERPVPDRPFLVPEDQLPVCDFCYPKAFKERDAWPQKSVTVLALSEQSSALDPEYVAVHMWVSSLKDDCLSDKAKLTIREWWRQHPFPKPQRAQEDDSA